MVPAVTGSIRVVADDTFYWPAIETGLTSIGYSVSLTSDTQETLRLFEIR